MAVPSRKRHKMERRTTDTFRAIAGEREKREEKNPNGYFDAVDAGPAAAASSRVRRGIEEGKKCLGIWGDEGPEGKPDRGTVREENLLGVEDYCVSTARGEKRLQRQ